MTNRSPARRYVDAPRRRLGRSATALLVMGALGLVASGAAFSATTANGGDSFASASAFDYSTTVSAASPWLWWRFGDTTGTTTADGSGNARTGTLSTVGVARGLDGAILGDASTSMRFDGIAGCVAAGTTHANPTTFSVEAWFRTSSAAGGLIAGFEGASATASGAPTTYDRQLFLTAAGNLAFGMKTSSPVTVTSPDAYNDGRWHHAAATVSSGGQKLYADGALVASNGNSSAASLTATWHAGCGTVNTGFTGAPATGYLQADLDEVAVYTTALSATAIANRVVAAPDRQPWYDAVQSSRPWGTWRLGEASGTTLADSSGNGNSATTSAGGITRLQVGAITTNPAMTFDGSAGCAVTTTTQTNPLDLSVEAWFRTTTTSGGWIVGFSSNGSANASASSHDRNVYMTNSGAIVFGTFSGTPQTVQTSASYNDGGWHHVVATLSSTSGQGLYLDGTLAASSATTAAENRTGYWHIGCDHIGSTWPSIPSSLFFNGTLDEVSVYSEALTASTVAAHYRAGLTPPDYASDVLGAAPWLYWHLGELNGREVRDASGNARPAWASNGGVDHRVDGVLAADSAMTFDGATGCVAATVPFVNPSTFSLEAWFRTTTTTGGPIIGGSTYGYPDNADSGDDRHLYMTNAGQVAFVPYDSGVGAYVPITSTTAYNDGHWHHAVATLGTAGRLLYVDGALVASGGTVTTVNQNHYWKVACDDISVSVSNRPTSEYFAGTVDEAAVYATQLSATAIAAHYRDGLAGLSMPGARAQSGPWAVWRLNELSGTTIGDDSGNARTGTLSATGATAGAPGVSANDTARTFDGSTGCAVSATSMINPLTLSIEVWLRTATTSGGGVFALTNSSAANASGTNFDRLVYMLNDGRLAFGLYAGSATAVTSTASYNDDIWHHVVATLGASGQKLYVDGSLAASGATTTAQNFTGYWHVGCSSLTGWPNTPSSTYLAGTLDEFAVSTVELDAATIAYRYALAARPALDYSDTITARAPTLYWKLDDTSGNASDSSGNAVTGTASGSGVTRRRTAAVPSGTSWAFDGAAGCIASASSYGTTSQFSIEGWFRTTSTTGGGIAALTDNSAATTSVTANFDRLLWIRDNGTVSFGMYNGGGRPVVTSASAYNDGAWHHAVATLGTDGMKVYLDGDLVASGSTTSVQSFTGYWHVGCGRYTGYAGVPTSFYFNGDLDETAIHPGQLSAAAVRAHYLAGAHVRPALLDGTATMATIMGTGTQSSSGDSGAATSATLNVPLGVVGDASGNVYVTEYAGCRVRKIAPTGTVSTFAGTGTCTSTGDSGAATAATLNAPTGLAIGADGSVYIAEGSGHRVRKVTTAGTISTLAGTGTASSTGDSGAATSATISGPRGLAVDSTGNVYIVDYGGHRIRKVDSGGIITTIMGTGTASSTGDGGAATSATLNIPRGVFVAYDGSIYVTDGGGCRVRKISTAGIASTVAGTGTCSSTGDGGVATSATLNTPRAIVGDVIGHLYVSEGSGHRIRRIDANGTITTVTGTGTASTSGDGGAASSATVNAPYALWLDPAGRLLFAEEASGAGARLRRIG